MAHKATHAAAGWSLLLAISQYQLLTNRPGVAAFPNPLDSVRVLFSDSGATLPSFKCGLNKTIYISDFLKLPERDKILLTRFDCQATRFFLALVRDAFHV